MGLDVLISREMRRVVYALLGAFLDICRLRRAPQDVPASRELFWLTLAGYTLSAIALIAIDQPMRTALAAGFAETVVLAAAIYAMLSLVGVTSRWLQTMTAIAGTGLLFSLLSAPLFFFRSAVQSDADVQSAIDLLMLLVLVWNLAVVAHILRHALSFPYVAALLLAFGLAWLTAAVLGPLIPAPAVS
ncbi:MAG: hypothetical protein ACREUU_12800 [Gammaproteobacteria bacterium]